TKITRYAGLAAAILFAVIFTSATANAQYRDPYYSNRNYGYNNSSSCNTGNVAYNNGYNLGFGAGSNDRAYGSSYDVDRGKAFRDGDSGYHNSGFGRDEYKQYFRQGYEQGYRNGYYSTNNRRGYNGGYYGNNYPSYYPNYGRGRNGN